MTVPSTNLLYPKSEEFLSSGTWTRPSSQIEWIDVLLVGGGGSGGGGVAGTAGGGGGGAETKWRRMRVTGDITVTIGAAATGGAADNDGNDGVASTLADGCVLSADGGDKGLKGAGAHGLGGNGGGLHQWTSINGTATLDGTVHFWAALGNNGCSPGGTGGKSNISAGSQYMASGVPGYSNPGATASSAGGGGGGSYGNGGDGNASAAGDAAGANTGAGGGGGGTTSKAGGNGGKGRCIIFWIEQ